MADIEFVLDEVAWPRGEKFHLTPTERGMLRFLANGYRQKEIAKNYGKEQRWVSNALDRIRLKMHAKTTHQMIAIGFREGLLK